MGNHGGEGPSAWHSWLDGCHKSLLRHEQREKMSQLGFVALGL